MGHSWQRRDRRARQVWIPLLIIVQMLLTLAFATTAGAERIKPPANHTPSAPVTTWTFGNLHTGSGPSTHPDAWSAESCVGYFATPQVEKDQSGRAYLHFGGYQQCSPSPESQSLEIDLILNVNGEYKSEAYSGVHVAWMVTAYGEPYCTSTFSWSYHMEAWGEVNGIWAVPTPAISANYTLPCTL